MRGEGWDGVVVSTNCLASDEEELDSQVEHTDRPGEGEVPMKFLLFEGGAKDRNTT